MEPRRKRHRFASGSHSENLDSMKEIVNYATTQWPGSFAASGKLEQGTNVQVHDEEDRNISHVDKISGLTRAPLEAGEIIKSSVEDARENIENTHGVSKTNAETSTQFLRLRVRLRHLVAEMKCLIRWNCKRLNHC